MASNSNTSTSLQTTTNFGVQNFITKATKIHKNFYSYKKSIYINNSTKLIITCPIHGDFLQTPGNHLSGHGCPYCGNIHTINKLTSNTLEFIRKAKLVINHQNKNYNYDKSIYVKANQKLIITCPIHGDFLQTPAIHLRGCGCPKCRYKNISEKFSLNFDDFLKKLPINQFLKYNYVEESFTNFHTAFTIICKIHGNFQQKPINHINGQGCPQCGKYKISEKKTKTTDTFINEAKKIWKSNLSFEKSKYTNSHTKLIITCPIHGDFLARPNDILNNHGCPTCSSSKGELYIENILSKCNIIYKQQIRIPNCKNKRCLPFDFGIIDKNSNILGLIEYQGEQHYKSINFFGGNKKLQYMKNNDHIKKMYCLDNNIPLLEISYLHKPYIPELINSFLKKLNFNR